MLNTAHSSETVVLCYYCEQPAELVLGEVIYPNWSRMHGNVRPLYVDRFFWRCTLCEAHVGCHPGTKIPLGGLATHELRKARQSAHREFDDIWKSGEMKRAEAYAWLSKQLGTALEATHIGQFDVKMCKRVIAVVKSRRHA